MVRNLGITVGWRQPGRSSETRLLKLTRKACLMSCFFRELSIDLYITIPGLELHKSRLPVPLLLSIIHFLLSPSYFLQTLLNPIFYHCISTRTPQLLLGRLLLYLSCYFPQSCKHQHVANHHPSIPHGAQPCTRQS